MQPDGTMRAIGGGGARETECMLFGFVPEWLSEAVYEASDSEDAAKDWAKKHGEFMSKWFWGQWQGFRGGQEGSVCSG